MLSAAILDSRQGWNKKMLERKSGANGMKVGDRVVYTLNGRRGVANEFLQDGDAEVSFDDGQPPHTVKWNYLVSEAEWVKGNKKWLGLDTV